MTEDVGAGRIRELSRPSRSKFKMIWHYFSTVRFPSYQFVRKLRSVQFGAWAPSASIQFSSVQARFSPSSPQWFGRSRGTVLGPLQQKSQPAGSDFVARVEGWCALLELLAYLSGMWCGVRVTQIQFNIIYKKFVQFSSPAYLGRLPVRSVQFRGTAAMSLRSVQFMNSSDPVGYPDY